MDMTSTWRSHFTQGLLILAVIVVMMTARIFFNARTRPAELPAVELGLHESPVVRSYLSDYLARVREAPQNAAHWVSLGQVLAANRLWSAAFDSFRQAAQLDPANAMALYYSGIADRELGRTDEAIKRFRLVNERFPEFAPAYQSLGDALLEAGQLKDAQAAFKRTVACMPDAPHGHLGLADVTIALHDARAAIEHVERALQCDPASAHAHYVRGLALRGLGRREEAAQELALGIQGRKERMPDAWTPLLLKHDQSVTAHLTRAKTLEQSGQTSEARDVLVAALEAYPQNIDLLVGLATIEHNRQAVTKSIEYAANAYRLAPTRSDVLIRYALCQEASGEMAHASQLADKLLELDPGSFDANYLKARLLRNTNQLDQVLHHLQAAAQREPANSMLQNEVGIAFFQLGRSAEALESLATAIECDPRNSLGYLNLAVVYEQLGQLDAARNTLLQGQRHATDDARIQSFLDRLSPQAIGRP